MAQPLGWTGDCRLVGPTRSGESPASFLTLCLIPHLHNITSLKHHAATIQLNAVTIHRLYMIAHLFACIHSWPVECVDRCQVILSRPDLHSLLDYSSY